MEPREDQEIEKELGDGVHELADQDDGALLSAWYLVSEWIMPDGSRVLRANSGDEQSVWQNQGLLGYAMDHVADEESPEDA